jgi:RNA polymerase sigma-70 factor (ECF subfamily)
MTQNKGENQFEGTHLSKVDFEAIFHLYYSPLCNYAIKLVNSYEIAEDLVQNLFLQLYERKSLNQATDIERFLIKSIKFKCIDYLRKDKKNRIITLDEGFHESIIDNSDFNEEEIDALFHFFVAKLPEKTREVFLYSRNNEMTYKEIANQLNISVKTVESQMSRALRLLRELLKANHFISFFFLFLFSDQ